MSKNSKKRTNTSDWRPMDLSKLERLHTSEIAARMAAKMAGKRDFQLLYQSEARGSKGQFRPFGPELSIKSRAGGEGGATSGYGAAASAPNGKEHGSSTADSREVSQKAYEEGFAKGHKEGLASGQKEAEAKLQAIESLLAQLDALWPEMVAANEERIVDLVCRAAEKVVLGQLEVDREVVKRSILHAFELVPETEEMVIHIHPEDYEFVELVKEDFFSRAKELKHVEIVSNPSVGRGGCLLETRVGDVDMDLEGRLEAVKESIAAAAGKQRPAPATASSGNETVQTR